MDDPARAGRVGRPALDPVLAAGGVLWRRTANGPEVGLVHRPRYDDWSFPKGKLEPGEPAVVAAVREIGEETGFRAILGRELGVRSYPTHSHDRLKINRYWVAEAVAGTFTPNHEVDRMWWGLPEEAAARTTDPAYTASLIDAFRGGPPPATVPVLVLRAGPAFAEDLVPMLAAFGPVEVHGCTEPPRPRPSRRTWRPCARGSRRRRARWPTRSAADVRRCCARPFPTCPGPLPEWWAPGSRPSRCCPASSRFCTPRRGGWSRWGVTPRTPREAEHSVKPRTRFTERRATSI